MDNSMPTKFTCKICYGLVNKPQMCESCKNLFCKDCVQDIKANDGKCPLRCKEFITKEYDDKQPDYNEYLNLVQECWCGCDQKFLVSNIFEHL